MYQNKDVYKAVDRMAPFAGALEGDNSGLLVGSMERPVSRALLALDLTPPVLEEAAAAGADLVVTHHPVIYKPLSHIREDDIVYRAISAGVSVLCAHTNLDVAPCGVNHQLAGRLGLGNLRPGEALKETPWYKVAVFVPLDHAEAVYDAMAAAGGGTLGDYSGCGFFAKGLGRFRPVEGAQPFIGAPGKTESVEEVRLEMVVRPDRLDDLVSAMKAAHPYEEVAYDLYRNHALRDVTALLRVGDLPAPMAPDDFAAYVRQALGAGGVKYVAGAGEIRTVAVCGGSGADYIGRAQAVGAQALVTGESKHNLLLEAAQLGMTLVDAGHFNTETVVLPALLEHLRTALPGLPLDIAETNREIIRYV